MAAPDPDDREAAFEAAGRLLAHRARSVAELERRLARKGFDAGTVAATLARLADLRLLDDAAFARERAAGLARRGSGPRLIRARLAAAGITGDLARAALEATLDEGEDALARRTLDRRYGDLSEADPDLRRKAAAYLVRRGFSPEVAGRVAGVFSDGGA